MAARTPLGGCSVTIVQHRRFTGGAGGRSRPHRTGFRSSHTENTAAASFVTISYKTLSSHRELLLSGPVQFTSIIDSDG